MLSWLILPHNDGGSWKVRLRVNRKRENRGQQVKLLVVNRNIVFKFLKWVRNLLNVNPQSQFVLGTSSWLSLNNGMCWELENLVKNTMCLHRNLETCWLFTINLYIQSLLWLTLNHGFCWKLENLVNNAMCLHRNLVTCWWLTIHLYI